MSEWPDNGAGWTRRRFWCVAGVLFVAQLGLILLFAEAGHGAFRTLSLPGHFILLDEPMTAGQLSRTFFAADPTVFAQPSSNGFSERAWLNEPSPQFEVPMETEPPAWLGLDVARLGTNFPPLKRPRSPLPPGLSEPNSEELDPWPATMIPEEVKSQSSFAVRGSLVARRLNGPATLRAWPNAELLSNSVVEIAVSPAGQVVAARLLGRSGLTDADTNALDIARNLRFRPSGPSPVWGRVVFEWQTIESSNAVSPRLP